MKIVFWSCTPGQSKVTSSMVACSTMASMCYGYNSAVLQTQYRNNNLQNCFIDPYAMKQTDLNSDVYQDLGLDALLRNVVAGSTSVEQLSACACSFIKQRLNVYLQTNSNNRGAYYQDLQDRLSAVMTNVDLAFDLTFVDTLAGATELSRKVMEEADLIVVCIPQSKFVIDSLFDRYRIDASNVFYLFGDYDDKQRLNIKTLQKMYKKTFNAENTAYILHNSGFADAINTSKVIPFFAANKKCTKKDVNYDFITSVDNALVKILKYAGVRLNAKDGE